MKKLYLFLSLFFISSLCFASGISERKKTIEEEQTRIESRLLANLNIEKIKLKHSDKLLSDYWFIDIKLKNGGYIQSQYCTEEAFFSGNIPIWFIGSYSIWNDMYFKENNERTGNAFVNNRILSILLNSSFESIDDYINKYDLLFEFTERLAKETSTDRSKRSKMYYSDAGFLDYLGNFETDSIYGMFFAEPANITEPYWAN